VNDIPEEGPSHSEGIDARVVVEVFVFFFDDGLAQEGGDFVQFGLHTPLLIPGQEGMDDFSFIIGNDGGVSDMVRKGKDPVQEKEKEEQRGCNDNGNADQPATKDPMTIC